MKLKSKKGFTLLEVIIVIIIIAILASVALPRMSGALDYARAREAINFIGAARVAIEACGMMNMNPDTGAYNFERCGCNEDTCEARLGISLPDARYFTDGYTIEPVGGEHYTVEVRADRTDAIHYDSRTGRITGTGRYVKIGQ